MCFGSSAGPAKTWTFPLPSDVSLQLNIEGRPTDFGHDDSLLVQLVHKPRVSGVYTGWEVEVYGSRLTRRAPIP